MYVSVGVCVGRACDYGCVDIRVCGYGCIYKYTCMWCTLVSILPYAPKWPHYICNIQQFSFYLEEP